VAWTMGIEVEYNISELTPKTGFVFEWNWQLQSKTLSLRPESVITKYTCTEAVNSTLQVVIWNDVTIFTQTVNITVEPDLTLVAAVSLNYVPGATPLNVTLNVLPLTDNTEGRPPNYLYPFI